MLVDSHCHLNLLDLNDFNHDLGQVIDVAYKNDVNYFLCPSVTLEDHATLCAIAERFPAVKNSVGLHPNNETSNEPSAHDLSEMAKHYSCVAIGETGLDYYRTEPGLALEQQRQRFRHHIQAALTVKKPLIIHTRQAAEDTLLLMKEEQAEKVGGVMHCFSESWDVAKRALEMNFYISFSGILTFKNAVALQEIAKKVPLDRILIETDSPYLAPVPFRGKQNHPALVKYVALALAELRQLSFEEISKQTTANFFSCFPAFKI